MAEPIIMPRQGLSVESCILTEWKKDVGDQISKGDIVFTFETDKSTFEKEAEEEGVLLGKFFEPGDEVEVLTNVGVIGEEGEDIEEFRPGEKEEEVPETEEPSVEEEEEKEEKESEAELKEPVMRIEEEESSKAQATGEDEVFISPRARRKAEKLNVDFKMAKASGPEGRIIERDIESLAETGPVFTSSAWQMYQQLDREINPAEVSGTGPGGKITTSDLEAHISGTPQETVKREVKIGEIPEQIKYEEKELSNIRKNIAGTMKQSLQSSAQLTLDSSFDATSILNYRQQIKEKSEELGLNNITLNAIILYAVSRTLEQFPKLNAHLQENTLKEFANVHLGMAVDTDRGLMAATIFQANLKSLDQLAREAKDIASKCQEGTISPDYLEGASFTVTNLGTLGIESFTPIINPPQTGILGVNTIEYKTKKTADGFEQYPAMGLSLTFDHRALDGAPAARFLQQLTTNLENFALLLAK